MTCGEYIKLMIGERSISEFALMTGVDKGALARYIKGTRIPMPDTVRKLTENKSLLANNTSYDGLMEVCGYISQTDLYIVEGIICRTLESAYAMAYKTKGKIYKAKWNDDILIKGDEV